MSHIRLESSISELFKTVSHIFIEMSSENPEDFEQFHFPATNCVSNKRWCGALILMGRPCATHPLVSLNDRAVQTNFSETCYISSKSWDFPLSEMLNLFSLECRVKIYKRMKLKPSSDQYLKWIDWDSRNMTWFYHSTGGSKQIVPKWVIHD